MSAELGRARDLMHQARSVVVLTGAGISAESGVPTFRGAGGLWKSHRPEHLATPEAFARDPRLVWEWYAWRRSVVAACAPNAAHLALARLAIEREHVTLVTQNVDGLHHRAADAAGATVDRAASEVERDGRVARAYPLEVHGAVHRDRCSRCGARSPGRADVDASSLATLPRCPTCDGLLRPDVVWFGEALDHDVLGRALAAAEGADACLVVGTSSVVYPAAAIPEIALARGAAVIEVNPEPTPLSRHASATLRGTAGDTVPALLRAPAPCGPSVDG